MTEMGNQHAQERGVASWYGFALAAALGITVYWPIVCLAAMVKARGAVGWNFTNETAYWIVLILVALWGAWGLFVVLRNSR